MLRKFYQAELPFLSELEMRQKGFAVLRHLFKSWLHSLTRSKGEHGVEFFSCEWNDGDKTPFPPARGQNVGEHEQPGLPAGGKVGRPWERGLEEKEGTGKTPARTVGTRTPAAQLSAASSPGGCRFSSPVGDAEGMSPLPAAVSAPRGPGWWGGHDTTRHGTTCHRRRPEGRGSASRPAGSTAAPRPPPHRPPRSLRRDRWWRRRTEAARRPRRLGPGSGSGSAGGAEPRQVSPSPAGTGAREGSPSDPGRRGAPAPPAPPLLTLLRWGSRSTS